MVAGRLSRYHTHASLLRTVAVTALIVVSGLLIASCDEPIPEGKEGRERVVIKGTTFWLEPALDDATRYKGLSDRKTIEPDGGMVFVFPQPMQLYFVMRDCLTDIDIAFLDGTGRVTAVHAMKMEDLQKDGETREAYEARLTRYRSRFAAQFAVEVAGGTLGPLGLKEGDIVELDVEGLKDRAQ